VKETERDSCDSAVGCGTVEWSVLSGKGEQNREMCWVGRENKTERCGERKSGAIQRDVLSGKVVQNRETC